MSNAEGLPYGGVRPASAERRREVLRAIGGRNDTRPQPPRSRRSKPGLAVIRSHDDGTFGLRLVTFEMSDLTVIKDVVRENMFFDASDRTWTIWSEVDRDLVVAKLGHLGFKVVRR